MHGPGSLVEVDAMAWSFDREGIGPFDAK